ncbi:MAG: NADH oxidoreductase [Alphaproteobacteria bacterium]|nr:MAG: NADH oxidoreductase [Alphaproteobacteria bacterium]
MDIPAQMPALVQNESGYSQLDVGIELDSLDPYVTLASVPVPRPAANQVLIRVALASVNPSDISFIKGRYGQPREAGRPAGFEGVGTVVASGGGFMAGRLRGKRVAFVARSAGSWAEYVVAGATECIPLRKDVRDEDGAAMIVNPLTAYAMFDLVRREGAKAFVMTAGASQLCKLLAGLARDEGLVAISIVRRDEQIEPLKALGATHVLNSAAPGFVAQLRDVLAREKPRILLDAVTGAQAADIFHEMGSGARWVVYGRLDTGPTVIREPGQMIFLGKRVEGFWLASWLRRAPLLARINAARAVQKRFASGRWSTDVAAIIPLAEAHARLPAALSGANAGKVMLAP